MMGLVSFPSYLTEEEEALQKKFQALRKKKREYQQMKAPRRPVKEQLSTSSPTKKTKDKPEEIKPEDATEAAKMLIKKGAIKFNRTVKDTQGFKRARTLEKRLQEPGEKSSAPPVFEPSTSSAEPAASRPVPQKGLYDRFVKESDRRAPRRGPTVYVTTGTGSTINEGEVRKVMERVGRVTQLSTDSAHKCAFVTFDSEDAADTAIIELNGTYLSGSGVQLKVSLARRQPNKPPAAPPSSVTHAADTGDAESAKSWATIAGGKTGESSARHNEVRSIVCYQESDDIF